MQHFFTSAHDLPSFWVMIVRLLFVLAVTIFLGVMELISYRQIYPRLQRTHNLWDDILINALHKPLQWSIWLIGLSYILDIVDMMMPQFDIKDAMIIFRDIIIIIAVVCFLLRYSRDFEFKLVNASKKNLDRATMFAVGKLLRIGVALIALLLFLEMMGVPISGLLAFGGAGAIVVGLAAKDMLANFFGGLMVYTDRPFTVGDWIRSPDHEIEGTVEHIGWRLTRIRNPENRPIYVPNALFSSIVIENPSRMRTRRIKTTLTLCYENLAKLPALIADLNTLLATHPGIDQTQTHYARFNEFAESSVNILVSAFTKKTKTADFLEEQEALLFAIAELIQKHGAEFAFPSQTVYSK